MNTAQKLQTQFDAVSRLVQRSRHEEIGMPQNISMKELQHNREYGLTTESHNRQIALTRGDEVLSPIQSLLGQEMCMRKSISSKECQQILESKCTTAPSTRQKLEPQFDEALNPAQRSHHTARYNAKSS
jgi:hypothetical protein